MTLKTEAKRESLHAVRLWQHSRLKTHRPVPRQRPRECNWHGVSTVQKGSLSPTAWNSAELLRGTHHFPTHFRAHIGNAVVRKVVFLGRENGVLELAALGNKKPPLFYCPLLH